MDMQENNIDQDYTIDDELDVENLFKAASGVDEFHMPLSVAQLIRAQETANGPEVTSEVLLDGGICQFHVFAGCAAVKVTFPQTKRFSWIHAKELYEEWSKSEDENKGSLILTVFPVAFEGEIYPQFTNLVFADFYEGERGFTNIVFCFDNLSSNIYTVEGINIAEINAELEAEARREESVLDEELGELLKEEKELDKQIFDAEHVSTYHEELTDIRNILDKGENVRVSVEENTNKRARGE